MATDPTTAEKAERLGLTKCAAPDCSCGGLYWLDSDGIGRTDGEVDALFRKTFPTPTPTPDYRAVLEELLAVAELAGSHAAFFGDDRARFDAALTHARKVLHGQ